MTLLVDGLNTQSLCCCCDPVPALKFIDQLAPLEASFRKQTIVDDVCFLNNFLRNFLVVQSVDNLWDLNPSAVQCGGPPKWTQYCTHQIFTAVNGNYFV
jgi:hypothetical protein